MNFGTKLRVADNCDEKGNTLDSSHFREFGRGRLRCRGLRLGSGIEFPLEEVVHVFIICMVCFALLGLGLCLFRDFSCFL